MKRLYVGVIGEFVNNNIIHLIKSTDSYHSNGKIMCVIQIDAIRRSLAN